MVESNSSSRDEEDYSCELPNFELKFFAGTRNLLILNEQELNQLVEQRHLALANSQKNGLYQPFDVQYVMHSGVILEIIFSDFVTLKFSRGFLCKTFLALCHEQACITLVMLRFLSHEVLCVQIVLISS